MTDTIASTLTTKVKQYVTLYFEEAEINTYPYAVYTMTTEERRSKEGVYRIVANTTIDIVAKDYDSAKTIYCNVRNAVENTMGSAFVVAYKETTRSCVDGIWTISINYSISQIS